jgi:uncharacterized protein YrzB (UPF0473 family)
MKDNGHEMNLNDIVDEEAVLLDVMFDDGTTKTMEVIAEFDSVDTGHSYVILADAGEDEIDELFMYRIEGESESDMTLSNDLTDEEFELGKQVVDALWNEVEADESEA